MVPPHSIEAEQGVLGALMIDNSVWFDVDRLLVGEDFYRREHRIIYSAMASLANMGEPLDVITVGEAIEAANKIDQAGGMHYLNELAESTPTVANLISYSHIVRERSRQRKIVAMAQQLSQKAMSMESSTSLVDFCQDQLVSMSSESLQGGFVDFKAILQAGLDEAERRQEMDGKPEGQLTMHPELDSTLDGLQDGKVYIIGGRTSMGKTAFALDLLYRTAQPGGKPWCEFSLEMTNKTIGMRAVSNASNIYGNKLRGRPKLNDMDYGALGSSIGAWMEKPIWIDQTPGLSMAQIRARLKAQESRLGPLGGVVIDHGGLVKKPRGMSATEGATEVSHQIQELAKEFSCPVIVLIQINRGTESVGDKRPGLSQLKQTGAWEEDCDVAILLYRDEYYNPDTQHPGITEAIIAKNRDGETKTIGFRHVLATGRYEEIGEIKPEPPKRYKKGDL